jgi:YtkA-like
MNQLLTSLATACDADWLVCSSRVRRSAYVRLRGLALCGVAAWFVTGCSKPIDSSPAVTVEHEISPDPPKIGAATLVLKLADTAAKPISGARITLEADMSHAGMATVFEEAAETEPGQYQAHLKFGMAGDWVILLHIRLPGGRMLERQFNVSGVRPN